MKNNTINIMKGLCMILVVAGHANCPFKSFIYLFHVPVFFMISGYLFKSEYFINYKNLLSLFQKRLCSLWIPYVTSNIILLSISSVVAPAMSLYVGIKIYFIKVLKILFFCFEPSLGGASWFIGTLFFVTLLFAFSNYFMRNLSFNYKLIVQTFLSISSIAFAFFIHVEIKLVIVRVLTIYILFFIGYVNKSLLICTKQLRVFFLGIIGLIVLIFAQGTEIDVASVIYPNPLTLIILSISGWYFTYSVALIFERSSTVAYLLTYIGSHTMPILLLHFVVFSLISLIHPEISWWQKTTLGIILPLGAQNIFNRLRFITNDLKNKLVIS